ncbi:heavy metal-responsive transcriptional regulator [Zooshikella harenae]|uniref:Heavy metal-responsive transcriptional regulator n=1 Tax=Zooshikella harenae TaxID=2827238 RepID=A0ABS5ZCU2_9GAMM|nr:heavy metal-responsive transcriptional regulator [Zooshikella harenae]MBU2711881.1 heavy metal-responsive transcriptional regulator [Zooshikella harenae]
METSLSIGTLAKECGLSVEAIRYYEKQGLMPKPQRTGSGYRFYKTTDIDRLSFILRLKRLGFSLKEIRELLLLKSAPEKNHQQIHQLAEEKLVDIEHRIKDMLRVRHDLLTLLKSCSKTHQESVCPILNTPNSLPKDLQS